MGRAVLCASTYGAKIFEAAPILTVGTSTMVTAAQNRCNRWYFFVFPRQLAAEHDFTSFTRDGLKLPHCAAHTRHEAIWNP